jgi:hypothetical protein
MGKSTETKKVKTEGTLYGYKYHQLGLAECIIQLLNYNYGSYHNLDVIKFINDSKEKGNHFDLSDIRYVLDKLVSDKILERNENEEFSYKLLLQGREILQTHKTFTDYIYNKVTSELEEKESIQKERDLTIDNLQRSIFKQKHAIWYFLANIVVTVGVALLTACLVSKFGWK